MEQVFAHFNEIPLTANMLRQLHRDLLQHSTKDERHRGEWKSLPNHVAAFDADGRELGIVFETRETLTGANRSTLKAKFAEFIAAGLVEAHGKGRGVFYARKR